MPRGIPGQYTVGYDASLYEQYMSAMGDVNSHWLQEIRRQYARPGRQVPVELIVRERQKGKTEKLIKMSAKRGARIVTNNTRMCKNILQKASKMGYTIPEPITYYEAEHNQPNEPLLLDDVDIYLLNKFYGVEAITMSVGKECKLFEERKLK